METCKYCEKVIRHGIAMFGGSPLHPECYDELQREMFGDEPLPESVLDLPWGGHPVELALDVVEIPF